MPYERRRALSPVLEAADLRPISRPNVNFGQAGLPIPTHAVRDYDGPNHLRDLRLPTRVLDSVNTAGIDAPLPISTTSSINWWPYPPWGQSTLSPTPSETASPSLPSLVAAVSASPLMTTTLSSVVTPTPDSSTVLSVTVISITAFPPATSLPSRPNIHTTAHSSFNPLYLIPVFIAVGLLVGALSGLLGYRWYLRRHAHTGNSNGSSKATLIPGPPYVPMADASDSHGGMQEASLNAVGSPSKYTRHGASGATKPWLRGVMGASSRRSGTRTTAPPSGETTVGTAASSHAPTSPTRGRSRGSAISPDSLSDEENSRRNSTRNISVRRNILNRLQRGLDKNTRSVSRDISRRTAQTYLSSGSAYSGTHSGDSRSPSAVPSSTPPSRDTNTEWVPGSGFRIVEEAISSPSTVDNGFPGRTSAWDNGEALRQAVDTHPGERWLAWTRSWASSPPRPRDLEDRFTAAPSRRTAQEKKDVDMLLRSPPQVTSSSLESTLTFSPKPEYPTRPATTGGSKGDPQGTARTRPALQAAARGTSGASSITLGDGHGTPAMRYAARHTALSRVEEILANSYSFRDLASDSPNAFGAALASLEDIRWAAGIEQRLAVAASADREEEV